MILGFELIEQTNKDATSKIGWELCPNNENPYSVQKMLKAADSANEEKIDKILSIPSPYARLHVTETALIEGTSRPFDELAPVYRRSISHLLDVFELFYRYNGIELAEKGVKVNKYKYQTLNEFPDSILVTALDLFRKNYGETMFANFYEITVNAGNIDYPVAYTSPFTMFFTPEDINEKCGIPVEGRTDHILFSQDKKLWKGIERRSEDFHRFVYALAKKYMRPDYNEQFAVLYNYLNVDGRVSANVRVEVANSDYFDKNYADWRVTGTAGIPIKVDSPVYSNVELLPLGYDTFVFENFINTVNAHDYSSVEDSSSEKYNTDIKQRTNDFCGRTNPEPLQWITIHDLLEDDVFVTTNHIDSDKYLSVPDDDPGIDAILPFKKKFFELFNLFTDEGRLISTAELGDWVKVHYENEQGDVDVFGETRECERRLFVTLKLPVRSAGADGRRVSITKTYEGRHIHTIDIDMGIYPFHQVTKAYNAAGPDNFYRIMLYLSNSRMNDVSDLKVYAKENGLLVDRSIENVGGNFNVQRHYTILQENFQGAVAENLYYMSLESRYYLDGSFKSEYYKDVRFDFVEATVDGCRLLMVPRFEPRAPTQAPKNCSVDLGTSNTYIAYGDSNMQNSFETNYGELVGKLCYKQDAGHSKRIYDFTQGGMHQDVEFIPTEFGVEEDKAHFPIRSVQLYQQSIVKDDEINRSKTDNGAPFVSMFSMNIPFKFNKTGIRSIGNNTIDTPVMGFKWFSSKQNQLREKNAFTLYVDELCFMLRNKIISDNCDPTQTKFIWMYPLSMTSIGQYENVWKDAYAKYFCDDPAKIGNNLYSFTESETPIEMAQFTGALNIRYLVGVDIGGGSTDVIVYDRKPGNGERTVDEPMLASSFGFAGNAMFGTLYGHEAVIKNEHNVWFKTLQQYVDVSSTSHQSGGLETRTVDINPSKSNITEVMDFILSKTMVENETAIRDAMATPYIRFVNLFHTAALIWEIANLCKSQLPARVYPNAISLSGNGSKLLLMSIKDLVERENYVKQVINLIFSAVYGFNIRDIDVVLLAEPKKATAAGAIKLLSRNRKSCGSQYSCIRYNGEVYFLNQDGFMALNEGNGAASVESQFEVDLGFGDVPVSAPSPVSAPKNNFACPELSAIDADKKAISEEVGQFFDLYMKIAATPLAGRWGEATLNGIKTQLLGYTSENGYYSEKMCGYIDLAKRTLEGKISAANAISQGLNDSVFLAVVGQIMAKLMEVFSKKVQ